MAIVSPFLFYCLYRSILCIHRSVAQQVAERPLEHLFAHARDGGHLFRGTFVVQGEGASRFVNEECDGGPILLQKAVDILPGDTPEVLQKRVMEQAEWKLLPKAVAMVCSGEIE